MNKTTAHRATARVAPTGTIVGATFTVALALATAFTFSCSSDDDDGGNISTCGGKEYDTTVYFCERGELVGSCRGQTYYPEYQNCENGEIKDGAAISSSSLSLSSSSSSSSGGGGYEPVPVSSSSGGGGSSSDPNIVKSFNLTLGEPFGYYLQNFTINVWFEGNPGNEELNPNPPYNGRGLDSVRITINNQTIIHTWKSSANDKKLNYQWDSTFTIDPVDMYCSREYPICASVYALGKTASQKCESFNRPIDRCTIPSSSSRQSSSSADSRHFQRVGGDIALTKTDKCIKLSEGQAASTGDICVVAASNSFSAQNSALISVEFADGSRRYTETISNPSSPADFPLRAATAVWTREEVYANYGMYYVVCTNGRPETAEWNNNCYLMLPEGILDMDLGTGVIVKVWKVQ